LDSLLQDAAELVESLLGPFDPVYVNITIAERGGGGANRGSMTLSPVRYPGGLSLRDSVFWLAVHELTHVLTYEWGDPQSPMIMEAIAYYVGGGFVAQAFDVDVHRLASLALERQCRLPGLADLTTPEHIFEMKNVFGAVAAMMGSFAGYVLDFHGSAAIRAAYTMPPAVVPHDLDSRTAAHEAAESYHRLYAETLGYPTFQLLENAWRDWLPASDTSPSPRVHEYVKDLVTPREYPFVHCWKCWRPNNRDDEQCSYCSAPLNCDGP
jgi:hypothetical protein